MKTTFNMLSFLLLLLISMSCTKSSTMPGEVYRFDLQSLAGDYPISGIIKGGAFEGESLELQISEGKNYIVITDGSEQIPWEKAKYLVCDVVHGNNYSAIIYIDFYKKAGSRIVGEIVQQGGQTVEKQTESPRISPKIGILPNIKTRIIFPLSYLDGQHIFMDRFPRQLKGTVMGRRLDISDIGKVALRFEPVMAPDYLPKIEIAGIYLTDTLPSPLEQLTSPVVDEFGQWKTKNWEGKTLSLNDLKNNLQGLETAASTSAFPDSWSAYGG